VRERRGAYRVWVGKPEGKKTPGKPSRRWEDNVKVDLQEVEGWNVLDRCGLEYGQVAEFCEWGNEPSVSI
jgi:hypothetical protein